MYRMSSAGGLTPRVAVMGALRATSRQVHAGAAPTTTVLTKGYSPSSEVLLAAQAASSGGKVVVATQHLHPEDLAVQQKVLDLLAEPTNLSVTVVDERASWQPHRTTSAAAPSPSFEDSEASAAVLHEELASVAELIIARLAQDTAGQLGEMEVLQAERGKTLAELVMQCVHEEVQSVLAAVQGGGITSTTTDSAEVKERFIASVSDRVAALIATSTSTAQSAMTSIETQVQSLVTSMERFETTLVEQVRSSSLHQTESPALTAAVGGDDLRQLLIRVIEETSHKQQESLTARMEEVLHATTESMAHTTTTTTTTPDTSLADSLQVTIEGSVRAASDEMRLVLSREIKKLARTSKRGAAEDSSEDSAMTPEAESLLLTKMEELIHRSELLASRVDLSDERMHEVVEGHQGTKQAVLELRSLLEAKLLEVSAAQATAVPHTHDAAPPPTSVDLTPVMAAVESLRTEVTRSSAQLDAMSSQAEARFLTAAQTIGDCVVDAVGKHSAEALSAALEHMNATLRQDVAHALEAHAQQQQPQQPTTQPAPGISVAEVASAVEAVMAPRLDALLARAEALAAQAPSSSINDQQLLAMASTITESMQDAMKTHFEHYGHARAAEEGGVSEQLASLRADVIAAVEAEMAKTHEVDLTPMYHYIDSMMAFVKEQLEARDKTLNTELAAATETITKATEASQAELLTSIKHMMEASAATAAATSQEKLQQQQQQEQRRRHEEEQAATHAAIDEVVRGALRKDVSAPMDLLSERLTAVDASSKAVHERLGELEATVVSAVADAKRAVDAARAAPPPQAAAAPASPQMDREAVHANLDSALSKAVAEMREALDGAVQHMKEQPPTKEATPAAVPAVDDAKLLPALEQLRSSQTAVSEQVENLRQMMADLTATEKQGSAQSSSSLAALEEALHRIDERLASAAQAQQQQQQHISAAPSPPPAAPVVVDLGPIQSSLDAIQRVLQQHRVAIEFLHAFPPVADAPTQPTTAQRSAWAELRAETSNRLAEMSQTLEDADRATSSSDGSSTTVVSQLREQLLALGSLLAKEKSLCAEVAATATARHEDVVAASSSPVSPADAVADLLADQRFSSTIASATTSAVEAAALPNAVRRAIADFEGDLRRELSALSSSQVSIREDLLNALRELSTNATSPPQTNDDDATSTPLNNNNSGGMSEEALTLLLEEHLTRITTELQSRSQPPLQEVAEAVRGATADLAAEVRAAKLDPAVIAEQVESHVAARVDDSLRRALGEQTMELKTLFPATTSAATPAAQTSTVESEGRLLEHITSILEKHRADTMKAATPPTPATAAATAVASPVAQQVKPVAATTITSVFVQGSAPYLLLHLVVYPLVLCAAVVLCAYYLFAGFLLVFVPKPGNNVVASTTTTTPPPTSSSPASPTTIEVVGPPLKSSRYVDRYM